MHSSCRLLASLLRGQRGVLAVEHLRVVVIDGLHEHVCRGYRDVLDELLRSLNPGQVGATRAVALCATGVAYGSLQA
jgi:hypothetical protein